MSTTPTTVRFAGAARGFNWLPVHVAEERGILQRHGLHLDFQRLGSVEAVTQAVREGSADLAITPPEGAVADHVRGGDLRIVAANSQRLPMSVVARAGTGDLAGLRGARIGTSSLTEGTAVYVRRLLGRVGLVAGRDYEFVLAGVHTTRWEALQEGRVDAAPQPTPWSLLAAREGYELVGEVSDAFPEILFAAVVGRRAWLEENADVVDRLVAALAEATDLVNDPAHEDDVLPAYVRTTTPDEPELAAQGFRATRDLGMWPTGLRVAPGAFATTLDAMVEADLLTPEQRERAHGVLDPRPTGR